MSRQLIAAAALTALAGAAQPAQAAPTFVEPYLSLVQARPFVASPQDTRSKDALLAQGGTESKHALLIGPFFTRSDIPGGDLRTIGGGIGYASAMNPRHPWALGGSFQNTELDLGTATADFNSWTLNGKYAVWLPEDARKPVVSAFGAYTRANGGGQRYDALVAVDQALGSSLYGTVNLGWASFDPRGPGGSVDDFAGGLGLTWTAMPRLSFSADYAFKNDVDGQDFWGVAAAYALDRTSTLRVGGGKHSTVFANYTAKIDLR